MALVQTPAFLDRNPQTLGGIERGDHRPNGALQYRGEGHVKGVAALVQQAARFRGFLASAFRQIDVGPPREPVLAVPGAFAVAEQDQRVHCLMAIRPAKVAAAPSSSSILSNWLYLHMRSVRLAEPVFI
jgi:hypothetical protein